MVETRKQTKTKKNKLLVSTPKIRNQSIITQLPNGLVPVLKDTVQERGKTKNASDDFAGNSK